MLALPFLLAQIPEPSPPSPFDLLVPLEIDVADPVLEGREHGERFEYLAEFSGTLHVWASAGAELDLFLRVEGVGGELLGEDDDSGGGTTPYLALEVERGQELVVLAAASAAQAQGSLELHLIAAPETEETRAAARAAETAMAEVRRLRQAQDLDAARARAAEAVNRVLDAPGAGESDLASARLLAVGFETYALGILQPTADAWRMVASHRSRTLPPDHIELQRALMTLAVPTRDLGDLEGARALLEQAVEALERTLPDEHPVLNVARHNLAVTIKDLGDLPGARALEERVLEIRSRTLPPDHPELLGTRLNYARTIKELGDLQGARALEEQVLEGMTRILPADHPDLVLARENLASTIKELGDLQGARALFEQVLEVRSRTLTADHPDLQRARLNLGGTIGLLGDLEGARALLEGALEALSRVLPADHRDLQLVRQNLAFTARELGDLQGARALEEQVLEVFTRTLPADHAELQRARQNLAVTRCLLGDVRGAQPLFEQVLEVFSGTLPDDHPELQAARLNLAVTIAAQASASGRERCADLILARCRAQRDAARAALLAGSVRETQARCETLGQGLDLSLSFATGYGVYDPVPELERPSFELSETTRGAALGAAALMRAGAGSARYAELRAELRARSEELAAQAQGGTTSAGFQQALARREGAERELLELASRLSGGVAPVVEFDVEALAARLAEGDAVVSYRRYRRSALAASGGTPPAEGAASAPSIEGIDTLCATVVRRGSSLVRLDLGPIEPIEQAARAWREALGTGVEGRGLGAVVPGAGEEQVEARGRELRRLVFDPLREPLAGAERVIVALDDVLHLIPIDALPAGAEARAAGELLGDRLRLEVRVTLTEILATAPPVPTEERGELVVVGGVAYGGHPRGPADDAEARPDEQAGVLRGSAWSGGFSDLPATDREARSIARDFAGAMGADAPVTLLRDTEATRERLLEAAPRARWLHVATHGWFAAESIPSWSDPDPLDRHSGLGLRPSGEEQVRGQSPMLLCGLALAGANLPETDLGRVPGLVTAEELAALDLSRCELAVLSACDSQVGVRRAGQGVASLQMALQMAGARSAITSLWKVPDEATRELMTDFYRRLWVEGKPKWQALWEAKQRLRGAVDERGLPMYATRDWAAWVLTGDPD